MISRIVFILTLFLLSQCGSLSDQKESNGLNRLQHAGSPYLQEHADNPVDWYEWGPEALAKAKRENKPLIISIGYAACHWCHVMERESFMDTAVARIMNKNFVAIKVDREERPDIDQIYLQAAQLISGHGGWPLNAFALPDGKPFYAATYFPKQDWLVVLNQVATAFSNDHEKVVKQAEGLTKGLNTGEIITLPTTDGLAYDDKTYELIFEKCKTEFDSQRGGFTGAPKFPMPAVWEFALQYHYLTGDETSLSFVTTTLDNMAAGGIYDHLAGGFSRYSTDANWRVPHFEKMLYDNGQLVSLYAHAYQVTQKESYADIVVNTLNFIKHNLTAPEGGFYASLNADTDGEEGKFYVWTKSEIERLVDKRHAVAFEEFYNVTEKGNWEDGKNILFRDVTSESIASGSKSQRVDEDRVLAESTNILLAAREKRVHPSVDDKILVAWNAIMLKGYADAYAALGLPEYLNIALANAAFLEKKMIGPDGKLWRNYKDGKASIDGFLDDYALLANAFISLYQITFNVHWLEMSKLLMTYAMDHFYDPATGLYFYTSDISEGLVARKMETSDNVIPSSNSVLAQVVYHHGIYYDVDSLRDLSRQMVNVMATEIKTQGPYYANWASLMGLVTHEPFEVAVIGTDAVVKSKTLMKVYAPTTLFMGGTNENLPLLKNKLNASRTMIYVCRNKVCKLPVEDVTLALKQLSTR